jgi:hypothetical protein
MTTLIDRLDRIHDDHHPTLFVLEPSEHGNDQAETCPEADSAKARHEHT